MCSFIICVLSCFVCLVHSDWFLHSMCHTPYIVMSTGNVYFHRYALYRILQLHSDCFLIPMCLTLYDIMSTRDVFFYPRCPVFYFFLSIRNAFSHPMYHMLYIIRTTCDVFLCPMCLMVCFVLSIGIAFSSDLLYVLYCHIHSGSILLNHVSYVLFCLWPFGYLSPSDVS